MTIVQQWQRGLLIVLTVGLLSATAALVGGLIVTFAFLPLELFWHRNDWGDLENHYQKIGVAVGLIALLPTFLSEAADKGLLTPDWPAKS